MLETTDGFPSSPVFALRAYQVRNSGLSTYLSTWMCHDVRYPVAQRRIKIKGPYW